MFCDTKKGLNTSFGNPYVFLKPFNNVWKVLNNCYDVRNIMILNSSKEKHVRNELCKQGFEGATTGFKKCKIQLQKQQHRRQTHNFGIWNWHF